MTDSITVRKMYKFRLYRADKKDRKLRRKLFVASRIWNHMLALQKRYYRLTGKYITLYQMNKHVLKLRKTQRFALWRDLHSQVCQDVCRRIDDAYQRFFHQLAKRPPKFKKARRYASFTFPQSGYKLDGDLGFASFLRILEWVAFKRGKRVMKIDRFLPTTKTCSRCGQRHPLTLRDRTLVCDCGLTINRDHNAAMNIKTVGASTVYLSERKTQLTSRSRADDSSLRL